MSREYVYRRRVQFADTDAAGIVHFAMFFRYMEEAEHAMWRDVGLSVAQRGSDVGWPRLAASLDFRRPLAFEDEFDVRIAIQAIGSRTIEYRCTIARDGDTIATGSMTIACVRHRPGEPLRAIEVPPDVAARLREFAI